MSIKVCGYIHTVPLEISQLVDLYFKITKLSYENKIGIRLGGNATEFARNKFNQNTCGIIFDISDDPLDFNAEILFSGDNCKIFVGGSRVDYGESLYSRMSRIQSFLFKLLEINPITKIILDVDYLNFSDLPVVKLHPIDYCNKIIKLFGFDNVTPSVRFVIFKG